MLRRTALARRVVGAAEVARHDGPFEAALAEYIDETWGGAHANVLAWCDELSQARAAAVAAAADAAADAADAVDAVVAAADAPAADAAADAACSATGGGAALPAAPYRVHFESLTTAPRETLHALCASIGVPFDEALLRS